MTKEEIKEYTDKLEKLLIQFEAGLSYEDRQIWLGMERLLDHYDQVDREMVKLSDRNRTLENKMIQNFTSFNSSVAHS